MKADLAAAVGADVTVLVPRDAAALAAEVRAAAGAGAVLVAIDEAGDPLTVAQLSASIGPLAIEAAPATRVNAVLVAPGADPVDVAAAANWLAAAPSTTGQVLRVSPRA